MRIWDWQVGLVDSIIVQPVWPVFWVGLENSDYWSVFFLLLNLGTSGFAFVFPHLRFARILGFIGLFFESAILHSDIAGWERMQSHIYNFVLIAFLFIFLPSTAQGSQRAAAWKTSLLITLAQITIILSYPASGIWRLRMAWQQMMSGMAWEDLCIGPKAFNFFITTFASVDGIFKGATPPGKLGPYLMAHPEISAPFMLLATVFELAGLFVVFQPRLYRAFGLGVAAFFVFMLVSLGLSFWEHFLLSILFLVAHSVPCQKEPSLAKKNNAV